MKNKIKTRKAASKRFKVTGSGKLVHKRANKGHLLGGKSSSSKRSGKKLQTMGSQATNLQRCMPNSVASMKKAA